MLLLLCVVFACMGVTMEVCFTWFCSAVKALKSERIRLQLGILGKIRFVLRGKANVRGHIVGMGYSHPFYMPTYIATAVFLFSCGPTLIKCSEFNFLLRYPIYVLWAFVGELVQNFLLDCVLGEAPSKRRYQKATKWNLLGLVRWPYPLYFGLSGYAFEYVYLLWVSVCELMHS